MCYGQCQARVSAIRLPDDNDAKVRVLESTWQDLVQLVCQALEETMKRLPCPTGKTQEKLAVAVVSMALGEKFSDRVRYFCALSASTVLIHLQCYRWATGLEDDFTLVELKKLETFLCTELDSGFLTNLERRCNDVHTPMPLDAAVDDDDDDDDDNSM